MANNTKNIMIVGVGGQGTLLTSRILGGITVAAGYDVKLSEVHGMAQRGGSVVTFVRYGEQVAEPIVEEGQADILIAFERLEALRYAHFLKKDGAIVINDHRIDPITVVTGAASYPDNIIENLEKEHRVYKVKAMEEAIKPGISTLDIDRLGEKMIRELGCIPNFKNYHGYPASICVSVNDEVVHGIPSKHRILQEGDIVSLDAGLIYKGYHSDAARTVGVGEISEEAALLIERTRMSFFEGMKKATAGNHL